MLQSYELGAKGLGQRPRNTALKQIPATNFELGAKRDTAWGQKSEKTAADFSRGNRSNPFPSTSYSIENIPHINRKSK